MYHTDWFTRQIQMMIQAICRALFKKDTTTYEIIDEKNYTATDILYKKLMDLLSQKDINGAENVLFENIKTENINYLMVALDFYFRVNEMNDDELAECNFSREEISEGLDDVKGIFGIEMF